MTTRSGSQDRVVRLRDDALSWRLLGDEVVALDVGRSAYLGVNPSGSLLWTALGTGATPSHLVSLVVERFSLDEERATRDVQVFLDDLSRRGLLEEVIASQR